MGCILQYGSILIYAISYFRLKNNGVAQPNVLFLVIPLQTITLSIFLPIGYKSILLLGTRKSAALGTILTLICFMASTYISSPYLFVVLYGMSYGIGLGLCYIVPVAAGWHYFPARKGLIAGITTCAYTYSAFTFSIISNKLINPDNVEPDLEETIGKVTYRYFSDEIANNFPKAIRWECLMWLILTIIAIALIRSPSQKKKLKILR